MDDEKTHLDHLALGCFICQFLVFNPIMATITLNKTMAYIRMQELDIDNLGYSLQALVTISLIHEMTKEGISYLKLSRDEIQLIAKGAVKGTL